MVPPNKILGLACCFFLSYPAFLDAARAPGLYQAEIAVADQTTAGREAAVRECLRLVLLKLTGSRTAAGAAALLPILEQASSFVQQYRYRETRPDPALAAVGAVPQVYFSVIFDEGSLNRALRAAGAPVWGRERPAVLCWLVLERGRQRLFVGSEEAPELRELLRQRARQRGISVVFPLLDGEDYANLRTSDIWGGFGDPVAAASARYQADVVVAAAVTALSANLWEGKWRRYDGGRLSGEWVTAADLPELVMEEGFDQLADMLAAEFIGRGGHSRLGDFAITVGGVASVAQYARVIKYLESLSSVSAVRVQEVREGRLKLALTAHGGEPVVVQSISLGRTLEPVGDADERRYRLAP